MGGLSYLVKLDMGFCSMFLLGLKYKCYRSTLEIRSFKLFIYTYRGLFWRGCLGVPELQSESGAPGWLCTTPHSRMGIFLTPRGGEKEGKVLVMGGKMIARRLRLPSESFVFFDGGQGAFRRNRRGEKYIVKLMMLRRPCDHYRHHDYHHHHHPHHHCHHHHHRPHPHPHHHDSRQSLNQCNINCKYILRLRSW